LKEASQKIQKGKTQLNEEKQRHEQTQKQLKEEKQRHEQTQKQLNEEKQRHEQTVKKFEEKKEALQQVISLCSPNTELKWIGFVKGPPSNETVTPDQNVNISQQKVFHSPFKEKIQFQRKNLQLH
jgi:single-stranded DNA-specific DHH superfamily exonuclease